MDYSACLANSDRVTISYARSGGPGGQNVNKVNTKVDMRFNVKNADWLSERVRERIMQMEKNRINKDGEIVISSTKTIELKRATRKMLWQNYRYSLTKKRNYRKSSMLLHTSLHHLQKRRLKRLPSCLQSRSRNETGQQARKHNRRRKQLEEVKIAGTDQMKHK